MLSTIMELANGPIMWVFAVLVVGLAALQSIVIYAMARRYIFRTGILTGPEVRTCLKTRGVVAIGPAVSVFVVALSMISMLGAPLTLMRIGMIGSASTELTAASIGAQAAGVNLGVELLTGEAFTAAVWCCAIMSSGYLIFVPLVTRGIGQALNKVVVPEAGKKRSKLAWVLSALLPLLIFLNLSYMQFKLSTPHAISLVFAAVLMTALNLIAGKWSLKWLKEWAMAFSVLGGILAGALSSALL